LPEYREYRRAMLYVYDGRYDHAIPILERLLERDPKNVLARRDLGASYLELRQYGKARAQLQQVVAAASGDYMAHYELGLTEEHLGQVAAAKENLLTACKLAPEAAQCQEELAHLLQKQK
jgi:tetratricopeptide (TPR) repeat protein